MHTIPPANNLKSLANLEQELCHLAKVDRATGMGTTVLNFFDLPPAPTQDFAALLLCGWAEPDDELLLPVFRIPNHGRDEHDFPWLTDEPVPGVAAVIDDVVEGFENSWRCRMSW
jgi:hypothetical protein